MICFKAYLVTILVVDNIDESAFKLNNDLIRIQDWAQKWIMSFNPKKAKPPEEVRFSHKTTNITSSNLEFKNPPIVKTASKVLGTKSRCDANV